MIAVELDPEKEKRLAQLAAAKGEELQGLVRRVLEEYLDLQDWKEDTPGSWAAAAVALAPAILPEESWGEEDESDGPR